MAQKRPQIYLVSAARRIWRWSPERRIVKNGSKTSNKYLCESCYKKFTKIHIDHIDPVGKAPRDWNGWDTYLKRLFCPVSNLQALCHTCHKAKTKRDNKKK